MRYKIVFLLLMITASFGAPAVTDSTTGKVPVVISGYLEDSEDGKRVEISVMGPAGDYEDFVIAEKGKGKELRKQVGQLVKLTGTVQTEGKKIKTFIVDKYEVLQNAPTDSGTGE